MFEAEVRYKIKLFDKNEDGKITNRSLTGTHKKTLTIYITKLSENKLYGIRHGCEAQSIQNGSQSTIYRNFMTRLFWAYAFIDKLAINGTYVKRSSTTSSRRFYCSFRTREKIGSEPPVINTCRVFYLVSCRSCSCLLTSFTM